MKTAAYALCAIGILWMLVYLGTAKAEDSNNIPPGVKVVFKCGSMIGEGEIFILADGELEHHNVRCGGPSI